MFTMQTSCVFYIVSYNELAGECSEQDNVEILFKKQQQQTDR